MNLLDKKLGLLILVALTFFACEDQIGEISLPPENNLGIFFVETSLENDINQIWAGGSPSSYSGQLMSGHYTDPQFGEINSTAFCDIFPEQTVFDTLTISSAKLISLDLSLRIKDATGTFSNSDLQILELFQLTEPVLNNGKLTSATSIGLGDKIGEAQFILYKDSINRAYDAADNIDSSRFDSNGIYNYLLNFTFTDSYKNIFMDGFIQAILDGSPTENDPTNRVGVFLDDYLNGLAIKSKTDGNAIITFSLSDALSNIKLDYSIINESGQTNLFKTSLRLNEFRSFSNIEPNENSPWSNSLFDNITKINTPFKTNDDLVYFQSGTNMLIDIDLSRFRNFRDTLSNVIIQKAELILKEPSNEGLNNDIPANLGFFLSSSDSIATGSLNNFNNESVIPSEPPLTAVYNSTENQYGISIPIYLQAIINNDSKYDNLIIDSNIITIPNNDGVKYLINLRDTHTRKFTVKKSNVMLRYYYTITDKNK